MNSYNCSPAHPGPPSLSYDPSMSLSRRQFFGTAAAGAAAAHTLWGAEVDQKTGMPTRILGRTGARVSILAFGGGSRFLMYKDDDSAIAAVNRALDLGITYIDTAADYGHGKSEERIGQVMKTRRKQVWLATKVDERNGDEATRTVEASLKRLQTDHIDLVHVHSLTTDEDLAAVEANDGVLKALYKLRDQKVIRAVGVTSHSDPTVLRKALERHDFDCTQMALNGARVGMKNGHGKMVPNEAMKVSFEQVALPVAHRKKLGIIAMKVFAQEALSGKAPVDKLISYSLSLPVSCAVVGMPRPSFIDQNVSIAKSFKPLPASEMRQLSGELSKQYKAEIDRFFATHIDA